MNPGFDLSAVMYANSNQNNQQGSSSGWPSQDYGGGPSQQQQQQPHSGGMMYAPTGYSQQMISPSSNPHGGFHPSSYGQGMPFAAAAALGSSSSHPSSSLGMSVSPPHWVPGNAPWGNSGSYVGSFGTLGTSFGRERDRELEAKYVQDFTCCGRHLGSLHELLEHYEEEHANLPPDARRAALNAVQSGAPRGNEYAQQHIQQHQQHQQQAMQAMPPGIQSSIHGDVPTPPGMMDLEMDEPPQTTPAAFLHQQHPSMVRPPMFTHSAPASPWASAFRPQGGSTPPQCLPPSLLSQNPATFQQAHSPAAMSIEQLQARAMKKAQRKAEKAATREEASASDHEGEKKFPCPIEGCGKVYKQANGLKYHLTRSINSGHGNVAAMGGLAQYLGEENSRA